MGLDKMKVRTFLLCGSVKLGLLFSLKVNDHFESPKLFGAIVKLVMLTIGFVVYVFAHDSFVTMLWFQVRFVCMVWCGYLCVNYS